MLYGFSIDFHLMTNILASGQVLCCGLPTCSLMYISWSTQLAGCPSDIRDIHQYTIFVHKMPQYINQYFINSVELPLLDRKGHTCFMNCIQNERIWFLIDFVFQFSPTEIWFLKNKKNPVEQSQLTRERSPNVRWTFVFGSPNVRRERSGNVRSEVLILVPRTFVPNVRRELWGNLQRTFYWCLYILLYI